MKLLEKIKSFKVKDIFTSNNKKKTLFVVVLGIMILVSLPVLADGVVNSGRIHQGVKINGISVGHLTPLEAKSKISEKIQPVLNEPIIVQFENKQWKLMPSDIKAEVNIVKSVDRAYEVGRKGSLSYRIEIRFLSWFRSVNSPLIYYVDSGLINDFIDDIVNEVDKEPRDAGLKISGTNIEIIKSQIGIKVKRPNLFSEIRDKVPSLEERKIILPTSILPAFIGDEGICEAKEYVAKILQAPLFLKYSNKRWEIKVEKMGELISFSKDDSGGKAILRATLNKQKTEDYIKELTKDISNEAKDAKFEIVKNKVKIISSVDGNGTDTAAAYFEIERVIKDDLPREIILKTKVIKPSLSTEEAQAMAITERVSTFKTNYSSGNTSRVHNIHLIARALDGSIVAPGETFSFNETIGPRTVGKGYKEAPTIVNGELVLTVGGGVCQVGTTIFNTAFFGGYPIVKRMNHSFYISSYPMGRDATVSYGGADFQFRNDTSAHILIKTYCTGNSVAVSFYSTDFGTKVSYKTSSIVNITPYFVEYVEDQLLPKGEQVVENDGINGFDVTVYRTVTKKGEIVRKDKFFSRYKPRKSVVHVGIKDDSEQEEQEGQDETVPEQHKEVTSTT